MKLDIEKWNMPLYKAAKEYGLSSPVAFHMPGHKLGRGLPDDFTGNIASIDLTEIRGTDNLHNPEGVIKEAQELAACAFGADRTFFIVNGSTCGVQAAIMTICKPGDKLIVGRDSHRSAVGGLMLAKACPWYIKTEFLGSFGIPLPVTPEEVERALDECPDAAGVFITSPNYYGICADIDKIACVVHKRGKALIVDEAHGAHLRFHRAMPSCAMDSGADICVQSAHKTLPAFTQGAYLHVRSGRVDIEKLAFILSVIETSSPSYVIMSSLDYARAFMENSGKEALEELLQKIYLFREAFHDNKYYRILDEKILLNSNLNKESINFKKENCILQLSEAQQINNVLQEGSMFQAKKLHDPTRLVINTSLLGMTGFEADSILSSSYGINVEMADYSNIVCITTVADRDSDFERLAAALKDISRNNRALEPVKPIGIGSLKIPPHVLKPEEIMSADGMTIELSKAAGMISKGMITPYPPGIPAVCPGEIILQETIEYIYNILNAGGKVTGLHENTRVSVVKYG